MTELDTKAVPASTDTWDGILDSLRRRYPGQRDSVLFCIYKLQQNPDLTLRDFRAEADLHGIAMAGRSLHSARLLLGLTKAEPKAAALPADLVPPLEPRARRRPRRASAEPAASIEDQVLAAVRQIQTAAGHDAERLRGAIRQAIAILQQALDG